MLTLKMPVIPLRPAAPPPPSQSPCKAHLQRIPAEGEWPSDERRSVHRRKEGEVSDVGVGEGAATQQIGSFLVHLMRDGEEGGRGTGGGVGEGSASVKVRPPRR